DLALAHRNAALDLGEVFPEPDPDQELFDLAERAAVVHASGIAGKLAYRLDIGGDPGESVRGALLAVERSLVQLALERDPAAHRRRRLGQQRLPGPRRPAWERDQLATRVARLSRGGLRSTPCTPPAVQDNACSPQKHPPRAFFSDVAAE